MTPLYTTSSNSAPDTVIDTFAAPPDDSAEVDHLEMATQLEATRKAIANMPKSHNPRVLYNVISVVVNQFERISTPESFDAVMTTLRLIREFAPDLTQDIYSKRLNILVLYCKVLGAKWTVRFVVGRQISDIEDSIAISRLVLELTPNGHPEKCNRIIALGTALRTRFHHCGILSDIGEAISQQQLALDMIHANDLDKASALVELGTSLSFRYDRLGDLEDVEKGIYMLRLAVDLTPDEHSDMQDTLSTLSTLLDRRYECLGELPDLESAIAFISRAIELSPDGTSTQPSKLSILGGHLMTRFRRLGFIDDIERAISAQRLAVDLTDDDDPDKPVRLGNLASSLGYCFRRRGNLEDLGEAISLQRLAVDLEPDEDPHKFIGLHNLACSLRFRFENLGKLADLEGSISYARLALTLVSDHHPEKPTVLSTIGESLLTRFQRLGELDDLASAIAAQNLAVELTPKSHPQKPALLMNLGTALEIRFLRLRAVDDLKAIISARSLVLELTPEGHPNRPRRLSSYANSLLDRFEEDNLVDDLENAIKIHELAVGLTPDNDADKPARLTNLSDAFLIRFKNNTDLQELNDLERTISTLRSSVDHTPQDHPVRALRLYKFGDALQLLFKRVQTRTHFDTMIKCLMEAVTQSSGAPSIRLDSAVLYVSVLAEHPAFSTSTSLLAAHSHILDLLPEIAWLGHTVARRYTESSQLGKLVNAAASAAITAGNLHQAVEWLETGRSLIWTQILSLRTPLNEIKKLYPALAQSLKGVQEQLQQSGYTAMTSSSGSSEPYDLDQLPGIRTDPALDRHRRLTIEYEDLVRQIRGLPGFQGFLRAKEFTALIPPIDVASGVIVILNVDSNRCDALGILPGGAIALVPLPDLSLERALQLRALWVKQLKGLSARQRKTDDLEADGKCNRTPIKLSLSSNPPCLRATSFVMEEDPLDYLPALMWEWIILPILNALDMLNPSAPNHLPHITWCPTGPLTQLPLHAAGIYGDVNGPRTFSYVVSSYAPSLSALRRCYEGATKPKPTTKALIVTQPNSPGHLRIPNTTAEGITVANILRTSEVPSQVFNHDKATVTAINGVLNRYQWVHLACHGSQKTGDATRSAFALFDGPLSLSDLMRMVADDAELAFLSACQTATGDAGNPEESVHLAAGMLAVGFKGVVATMWSIWDEDAPTIVEAYYKKLIELRNSGTLGIGQTGAAYALHEAVAQLRAKVGEDNFGRWAPFVHFGV